MTLVSLVKNSDPAKAVRDAIELAGGLKVSGTVLIKPNLSCAQPAGSGLVTNAEVVAAVVRMVAEQGARPVVGDLPILGWDADRVFDATGIRAIERAGGELLNWETNHVEIQLPGAKVLKKVRIAKPAIEADAIINMPVLKLHFFTHISGGMKNLFGLVEPAYRPRIHVLGLDEPLVDLYEFLRPKIVLNVMDATCIAQSVRPSGPYYGPTAAKSVSQLNMVLASTDTVALDAVAARIVRVDPGDVEMVRIADSRGLGEHEPADDRQRPGRQPQGQEVADVPAAALRRRHVDERAPEPHLPPAGPAPVRQRRHLAQGGPPGDGRGRSVPHSPGRGLQPVRPLRRRLSGEEHRDRRPAGDRAEMHQMFHLRGDLSGRGAGDREEVIVCPA